MNYQKKKKRSVIVLLILVIITAIALAFMIKKMADEQKAEKTVTRIQEEKIFDPAMIGNV